MAIFVFLLLAMLGSTQCKLLNQSCQQIKSFVDGHNIRRQNLTHGLVPGQPIAADMKYMVWDEELAAKAAKWASVLRYEHNPDKTVGSGRFSTGENLYWMSTTDHNAKLYPDEASKSWWDEHYDYEYGPLTAQQFSSSKQIGHYTQMAWADTKYLGCAISQFSENGWLKFFVVCNYGPTGNYLGQAPYKRSSWPGRLVCATGDCRRPYGEQC